VTPAIPTPKVNVNLLNLNLKPILLSLSSLILHKLTYAINPCIPTLLHRAPIPLCILFGLDMRTVGTLLKQLNKDRRPPRLGVARMFPNAPPID